MREAEALGGERGDEDTLIVDRHDGVEGRPLGEGDDGLGGGLRAAQVHAQRPVSHHPASACRRSEATTTSAPSAAAASRKSAARYAAVGSRRSRQDTRYPSCESPRERMGVRAGIDQ